MKKPKPPKSFEEVEAHVRTEGFCVDPWWFWKSFGEADWYDTNGKPVLSWKQKLRNLDKLQRSWGQVHRCSKSGCKKAGVYDAGRDRDGHPLFRCIDHKPQYHPSLPKEMTSDLLYTVKSVDVNVNNRRNEEINKLKRG